MKIVVIQDKISGGYVAYYKGWVAVVFQGETIDEAKQNLRIDVKIVLRFIKSLKNDHGDNA